MKQLYLAGMCLVLVLLTSAFSELSKTPLPLTLPQAGPGDAEFCPPLDPPTGNIITVSSEAALRNQAYNAAENSTIIIQPGIYDLTSFIQIIHNGITLRGSTGQRGDVILDLSNVPRDSSMILIDADDVTIADLTIRNAHDHGIAINGKDRPILYNLRIYDIRDQLVKVNPVGDGSEDGLLACSRLEYTTSAPDSYTNGISAHNAHRWNVRDNEWYRIRTIDNTPVPTILFWSGSSDTVVERNLLIDCYQGIAFGNASHSGLDHSGGIVRNNFIYSSLPHDVAIEMVHAQGWTVAHNTVLSLNPAPGLTWGMEARFPDTQGAFIHNLTNLDIWHNRDGANATETGNLTNAQTSWFVNAAAGDLHLVSTATTAIDQVTAPASVTDDFDGNPRPIGPASDIGADEYGIPAPAAVTDLRVSHAVTGTGMVTATLRWTPPANALTTTLRYTDTFITASNWNSIIQLTNTLSGSATVYTATVPYSGGTLYFALKTEGKGGVSDLSNNAFWPSIDIYLPIIIK